MRRLMTFFLGVLVGGGLLLAAQHYHLIRSDEGFHLVPKIESKLATTYIDIRKFTFTDWLQHSDVVTALGRADKQQLTQGAVDNSLRNATDRLFAPEQGQ